jgi:hypothetical protein
MSYILQDPKKPEKAIELVSAFWHALLIEAEKYGWKPRGTFLDSYSFDESVSLGDMPLKIIQWTGQYDSNDRQIIRAEDTKDLLRIMQEHKGELEKNKDIRIIDEEIIDFFSTVEEARIL